MKYLTILAAGLSVIIALAGPASAKSLWDQISESAPRSDKPFVDIDLTAPRSDGVFGELEKNAP